MAADTVKTAVVVIVVVMVGVGVGVSTVVELLMKAMERWAT